MVFSGTILLELARRGLSRERAYELVQRNAMRAFHEQTDFKALLLADAGRDRGAAAGGDRRRRSTSTCSCATSARSCDRVFADAAVPAAV